MKVYIGADHRGVPLKSEVIKILKKEGLDVVDVGTDDSKTSCDYPDVALKVAEPVAGSRSNRGILICMSGIGQTIAANKVKGAYAALCYNAQSAQLSRLHNNANILVLSSKFTKKQELSKILKVWLRTDFEGGRHLRRLKKIKKIENKNN